MTNRVSEVPKLLLYCYLVFQKDSLLGIGYISKRQLWESSGTLRLPPPPPLPSTRTIRYSRRRLRCRTPRTSVAEGVDGEGADGEAGPEDGAEGKGGVGGR